MKYYISADRHIWHRFVTNLRWVWFLDKLKKKVSNLPEWCTLIILWDILFGNPEELAFLRDLKFSKRLIMGNHDKHSKQKFREYFDIVVDEITMNVYGKKIVLSHKPIFDSRYFDFNIHGHFHDIDLTHCMNLEFSEYAYTEKHKLYSPEIRHYQPLPMDSIICKNNSLLASWRDEYLQANSSKKSYNDLSN